MGTVTSGGTESISLAMLACRNFARNKYGITKPEIIAPKTVHTAFYKACHLYGIKLIKIGLDRDTFQADLNEMEKAINKNTICLIASCPNYPHGIVDPIEQIARLVKKRRLLFHVDCCLGSFNLPFARECGQDIPNFDLSLDGITSISVDHHKHGLAPKGISMVLWNSKELRHASYYISSDWVGGIYGTLSFAGSRSGAPVAGAWYAMMHLGREKFKDLAQRIFDTTNYFRTQINSMSELKIIGNPQVNVISFQSRDEEKISSYSIHNAMKQKGWNLTALQDPVGIHISLNQAFARNKENFMIDLKISIQEVIENPLKYENKNVAIMYGNSQKIPINQIDEFDEFMCEMLDAMIKL